eukprot:gene20515-17648_t
MLPAPVQYRNARNARCEARSVHVARHERGPVSIVATLYMTSRRCGGARLGAPCAQPRSDFRGAASAAAGLRGAVRGAARCAVCAELTVFH